MASPFRSRMNMYIYYWPQDRLCIVFPNVPVLMQDALAGRKFYMAKAWRYYFQFYHGLRGKLVFISLLSMVQAVLLLPVAWMIQQSFDRLLPKHDFNGLILFCSGMVGLYFAQAGLVLWTRHRTLGITKIAVQRFRDELVKKVFTLSRSTYTQMDRAQLHTSIVQDSERIDVMSNALITGFIPSSLMCVALGLVLLYLNPSLFLILFILLPIFYLIARTLGGKFRRKVRAYHKKFEDFSKGVGFITRMLDLTLLQTAELLELEKQRRHHDELRETSREMAWLGTAYTHTQSIIAVLLSVVILAIGGRGVIQGSITLGDLLAFFFAFALLKEHLRIIHQSTPVLFAGTESLKKLFGIIQVPEENPYRGTKKISFSGAVEMKDISFAYQKELVLKNIDFQVRPGQTVAVIGPSGAGKSTLLNLILGFYRPQSGQAYGDDIPYKELDIRSLRTQIGILLQDPMLFEGSLEENITYGCEEVAAQDLNWAIQMACAKDFIDQLPDHLETSIGDQGVLLSGGQSQRIALARALLKKPSLLILDEPTNHLDPISVQQICDNLMRELSDTSILIISHDERMMEVANYIYLIEGGRLSDQGSPEELKQRPAYLRLFSPQSQTPSRQVSL